MGKPLDPAHDHKISLEAAAAQTGAYRKGRPSAAGDCGAFNAKPVLELLQQPGCVGVRIYQGLTRQGMPRWSSSGWMQRRERHDRRHVDRQHDALPALVQRRQRAQRLTP
jgi:hypothetical protein